MLKAEHRDGHDCLVVEGDQQHVDLLISQLGLESAKGVETPDVKKTARQQLVDSKTALLDKNQAQLYRSLVMRAACLSQDRPDISHAVKNLSRRMVCPNEADLAALKRLARYLRSYPSMSAVFHPQMEPNVVRVQVDSDHAGCAVSRRSTTGMIVLLGTHAMKHLSNVQSTIALSTGESEYYALAKGGYAGLGMQSLLQDLCVEKDLIVESDSSAAKGHVNRIGLGKMRHIQARFLWLQERTSRGDLKVNHAQGIRNRADVFTKPVTGTAMKATMARRL